MACVGLAYYAGLVCDAWPFLQLQLQRPPPLSAHASPPPPPPYQTIPLGGGGWAGNARRLTIYAYMCYAGAQRGSVGSAVAADVPNWTARLTDGKQWQAQRPNDVAAPHRQAKRTPRSLKEHCLAQEAMTLLSISSKRSCFGDRIEGAMYNARR